MNHFKSSITKIIAGSLSVLMLAGGCNSINGSDTVMTIDGGDTISLGYANFTARYQQSIYDSYYSDGVTSIWDEEKEGSTPTFEESVKDSVIDALKSMYVSKEHAADYGISLSDDDTAAIEAAAEEFIADNTDEAINALGAKKEYVVEFLTDNTYLARVRKAVENETEMTVTDNEADQSVISYVFISAEPMTDEETGEETELGVDELAQLSTDAQTLSEAEDLNAAAEELGYEVSEHTFTTYDDPASDYTVGEEVINAALKLENGEISPVISVDGKGYYVVRMDSKHDEAATASKREQLESNLRSDHYNEVLEGWKEEHEWVVDEAKWSKVRFTDTSFTVVAPEETETEGTAEE